MNFDDVLNVIGEFGLYQRWLFLLLGLPAIFCGSQMMVYVFTSATPLHRCYVESCDGVNTSYIEPWLNYTLPSDSCHMYSALNISLNDSMRTCSPAAFNSNNSITCGHWVYDRSVYTSTVVTQFDLVCSKKDLVALSESVYMAGITVGAVLFGTVADRIGRRKALMISLVLSSICSLIIPFMTVYTGFLVLRFFCAAAFSGVYQTVYILAMEIVGKSKRVLCAMLLTGFFACGEILLGVGGYYIRDWQMLQLAISAPTLVFLAYFCVIPESPRWLISQSKMAKAKSLIVTMTKKNRVIPKPFFWRELENDIEQSASMMRMKALRGIPEEKYSILDLFKTPRLRIRSINIFLNWFMNTIVYYGLSLVATDLGGNEFFNFMLVSAVELPAYAVCLLVLDRWGRRAPLCLCMIMSGIACVATAFIPGARQYDWIRIALSLVGKFGTAAAFAIIYIFTAELFPTVVRNVGVGTSSMLAHIGGILAPYIATLSMYYKPLPMLIFGTSSLLAGIAALQLPETLGVRLPETILDAEVFGRHRRNLLPARTGREGERLLASESQQGLLPDPRDLPAPTQ